MDKMEDVIQAAWHSPQMRTWNPNTAPTARATVRKNTGLILPPAMEATKPVYFVDFKVEFGTVDGAPAYIITGTCNGTSIVVAQGFMESKH